jgi:hypothetical protein
LVFAGTALASGSADGAPTRSNGLTTVETLGWLVGVPLLIIAVITVLVMAGSRGERYRPGLTWWAAPEWFNGPGAAEPRTADEEQETTAELEPALTEGVGGARARW